MDFKKMSIKIVIYLFESLNENDPYEKYLIILVSD